ncbi:MAG: DUF2007 domain-containing protein [Dehalococcoidia bacterium]
MHLTTAPDQFTAEMWCETLGDQGIPAMIRPSDAVSFLGVSSGGCRVLVPEDRREDAAAILTARTDGEAQIEPL